MKRNIPNFITLLNLTSGVAGIIFLIKGEISASIYLVFLAGMFDFLDGLAARLLKAHSEIGKSLDSLADIVSFGVLPALIVYSVLQDNLFLNNESWDFIPYMALLVPAFSALRLAIFNNDEDQRVIFRGLPTPANAFMLASASWSFVRLTETELMHSLLLAGIAVAGCILMVSRLKMFSLKFSSLNRTEWVRNLGFLIISGILIIIFGIPGIFLAILLYIFLSILMILPDLRA